MPTIQKQNKSELQGGKIEHHEIMKGKYFAVESVDINKVSTSKTKRALDIIVAISAIVLLSPVFVIVAIAVKSTSPGTVFFRQKRSGLKGVPFEIYKFRSMRMHREEKGITQAKKNDNRITRVGRFIRKTSLDEIPQFINVLKGDMSVVGPRPHALEHDKVYSKKIKNYSLRYSVKPGITGLAQVHGFRGETDTLNKMEKRVELDLMYLSKWTILVDIKIIAKTFLVGFVGKNAY